jgi:uncharacterized membrane protein YsdA (DUF1294 family)
MGRQARRNRPILFHSLIAAALGVAGAIGLWWGLSKHGDWHHWAGCWLVAINVVTFGYYGYDKGRARSSASRVPEAVLHGLTASGGSIGAYAAMRLFHHKTIKGKFQILFWCIVVLQAAILLWIVVKLW